MWLLEWLLRKTAPARCTTRGSPSRAPPPSARSRPLLLLLLLPMASSVDVETRFLAVVDEYVAAYPLVGRDALSPNCVRLAAAKILLHQRQVKSTGNANTPWPEEGAKQLAAILLVIFVQECLVHSQQNVLGVAAHEFYELLSSLVRSAGVTRSDLITELIDVDKEGSATRFASSNEIARLWVASPEGALAGSPARLRAVLSSEGDGGSEFERGSWSNESLPELAREARLGGIAAPATPLYRRRLFLRSRRFRICSTAVVVIWLLCTEFICFSRFYGHDFAQVMLFATSCSFGTSIVVASFPTDLAAQKRFTLLPTCATALSVITATYSEFFYLSDAHVNTACKLVHAALCLAVNATWSSSAILSAHGSYSWQKARLVYLCDGLSFLITTILLSHLGPPPAYPPGNVAYPTALFRAAISIFWAAILTKSNRLDFAAFADRLGWNHVTLNLSEIHQPVEPGAEGNEGSNSNSGDPSPPLDGAGKGEGSGGDGELLSNLSSGERSSLSEFLERRESGGGGGGGSSETVEGATRRRRRSSKE